MKKILSAILAFTMLSPIAMVKAEEIQPSLIYNCTVIGEEGSMPFIENDRTMLPFRYLLEEIGATVDFDEETRTVKAAKDDISIAFSLDDTYIDITKGEEEPERVVQDTKNIIKDDRVYVPIRFMSEAFELNVGWDADQKTAIIIDMDAYVDELFQNSPYLQLFMNSAQAYPSSYTQTLDLTFDLKSKSDVEDFDFGFSLDADLFLNDGAVQLDALLDIATSAADVKPGLLEDIDFSFMYNDGIFYAKTNLLDKLAKIFPDNEEIANISALADKDTWFKADINSLFEALGLPSEYIGIVKASLSGQYTDSMFRDAISSSFDLQNIATVYDAETIDEIFNLYNVIFNKLITVTEKGEGDYECTYDINAQSLIEVLNELYKEDGVVVDDFGDFEFELKGKSVIENNLPATSDAEFTLNIDADNSINMTINSTFKPDTKEEIVTPGAALDLINIINILQ